MIDPNEFNLPEFDTEALVIAQDLDIPEAFEVAVEVETRENSVFIPLDEISLAKMKVIEFYAWLCKNQ